VNPMEKGAISGGIGVKVDGDVLVVDKTGTNVLFDANYSSRCVFCSELLFGAAGALQMELTLMPISGFRKLYPRCHSANYTLY